MMTAGIDMMNISVYIGSDSSSVFGNTRVAVRGLLAGCRCSCYTAAVSVLDACCRMLFASSWKP